MVELPFEMKLPPNRAFETAVVPMVRARVQGAGWQLVNFQWFSNPRCAVFVKDKLLSNEQSTIQVTKMMITQGMQVPIGVLVLDILSDPFTVQIGMIDQKKVPILPVLNVQPREGFIVTNTTSIIPDSITIRSNRKTLAFITAWKTAPIELADLFEPRTVSARLSDTLSGIVEVPSVNLNATLNVQQMAEVTFDDVPVKLLSAPPNHSIALAPAYVTVTVRGGINQIAKLTLNEIVVFVEYTEALANTTGNMLPRVALPPDVTIIQCSPSHIQCVRRVMVTNKTKFVQQR